MRAYDIYIEDAEGKKTGFMLAKDSEGKKMWRVTEAPPLSPRYGTGAVGYEQFPVEQEMVWAQDDWSGGFGDERYKQGSNNYYQGFSCDCRWKNKIILGPTYTETVDTGDAAFGTPSYDPAYCVFKGELYVVSRSSTHMYVHKWSTTTGKWTEKLDKAYAAPQRIIVFDDWIIAAASTRYWYSTDGTSWTEVTKAISYGLAVVNDTLWGADGDANVYSVTDPSASWGSATQIGGRETDIEGLLSYNGVLYIGKDEGLFSIDSDGFVCNLLDEYLRSVASYNFAASAVFRGEAYMRVGPTGLILYDGLTVTEVSPILFGQPTESSSSIIVALQPGFNWLYVGILEYLSGTSSYTVFAGRKQLGERGGVEYIWHPIIHEASALNNVLVAAGLFYVPDFLNGDKTYLWLGTVKTLKKPCYSVVESGFLEPQNAAAYTFETTGYLITGWVDYNLYDVEKAFQYLVVNADDLSSTVYITFYYETDDSGTWTVIGKAEIDGKTVLPLPKIQVGDETRQPIGRKIRLKIELTTGSSSSTPILRSFSLHAIPAFTPKRQFTFAIECADSVARLNNTPDTQGAASIRGDVWHYRKEVWPVTLTDIDGIDWAVKLQYPVQEQVIEKAANWERHILVTAIEATVS